MNLCQENICNFAVCISTWLTKLQSLVNEDNFWGFLFIIAVRFSLAIKGLSPCLKNFALERACSSNFARRNLFQIMVRTFLSLDNLDKHFFKSFKVKKFIISAKYVSWFPLKLPCFEIVENDLWRLVKPSFRSSRSVARNSYICKCKINADRIAILKYVLRYQDIKILR